MKKSEGSQRIYRMHNPAIKTKFGNRVMTEIGNVKGLIIDETANYILIPFRKDGKDTTSWGIHQITKECEVDVVSFDNLHKIKSDFDCPDCGNSLSLSKNKEIILCNKCDYLRLSKQSSDRGNK